MTAYVSNVGNIYIYILALFRWAEVDKLREAHDHERLKRSYDMQIYYFLMKANEKLGDSMIYVFYLQRTWTFRDIKRKTWQK